MLLLFSINLYNCELSYRHNNKLPFLLPFLLFSRQKISERWRIKDKNQSY